MVKCSSLSCSSFLVVIFGFRKAASDLALLNHIFKRSNNVLPAVRCNHRMMSLALSFVCFHLYIGHFYVERGDEEGKYCAVPHKMTLDHLICSSAQYLLLQSKPCH